MPRAARLVIPGLPHHVVQRGNRQQRIFFNHGDCRNYVEMLAVACATHHVACLAWCLMANHVHLILKPTATDGLRAVLSSVNTRFAQRINNREKLCGHLIQDRYKSFALAQRHLMAALRYVENNPVKAGLVETPADWRWSSARAHLGLSADPLTDLAATRGLVGNWSAYLRDGAEAADTPDWMTSEGQSLVRGTVPA